MASEEWRRKDEIDVRYFQRIYCGNLMICDIVSEWERENLVVLNRVYRKKCDC